MCLETRHSTVADTVLHTALNPSYVLLKIHWRLKWDWNWDFKKFVETILFSILLVLSFKRDIVVVIDEGWRYRTTIFYCKDCKRFYHTQKEAVKIITSFFLLHFFLWPLYVRLTNMPIAVDGYFNISPRGQKSCRLTCIQCATQMCLVCKLVARFGNFLSIVWKRVCK